MTGFLCRCPVCGREERTGPNRLRDGWPLCPNGHGSLTLIDNEAFKADIDRAMGEIFAPVKAARVADLEREANKP